MIYLYIILSIVISWFLWNVIHELSHLVALKQFRYVKEWKLYPYPHLNNGWHWARLVYTYYLPKLTNKEEFLVKMAPRVPNMVAAIMFVLFSLIPSPYCIFWIIFWSAGLIDLFIGSIGRREHSDLIVAAKAIQTNPWYLRIFGFGIIILSVISSVLLLVLNQ